jgi:exodeoxyribonuclease VII large subunit
MLAGLQTMGGRALRSVQRTSERAQERLIATARRLPTPDTLLGGQRQYVDDLSERAKRGLGRRLADARGDLARSAGALRPALLEQRLTRAHDRLAATARLMVSLHPHNPLKRGYALVTDPAGRVVMNSAAARKQKDLSLTFIDGEVSVYLEQERAITYIKPKSVAGKPKPEQPDLF